ncbi:MAG: hypothetical protein IKU93_03200 [Alistipes sp.]|nr:hypothetical protein [Alistipes sp.]
MAKKEEKRSFVMYDSFLEAMKHLNDAEFRECVLKIRDYALEGNEEESASPMVNVIMALAKPNLDSAKRRYMASVENGKKGAEFGKLGGAPKGNQNARKKQPLKQPLDVDVDDNVNEDVDVNVEVDDYTNADVNNDAESTPTGLESSYNSSIQGVNNQIENYSEQFEDREEKIKPLQEVNSFQSNSCDVRAAGKNTSEALSSNAEVSSAAPQRREEGGVDMSSYMERIVNRDIGRLATMRQRGEEFDQRLLNATIDNVIALYGRYDHNSAYKAIVHAIDTVLGGRA